jgi:hypothetical protein
VECCGARVDLVSNDPAFLDVARYFDRHSASSVVSILDAALLVGRSGSADATVALLDARGADTTLEVAPCSCTFRGDFRRLRSRDGSPQHTLFGNLGFLFRYLIVLLERTRSIHTLHACAFHRPEDGRLVIVLGTSQSGKSIVLLEALRRGFDVFASDLVHFESRDGKLRFHRGASVDNIWPWILTGVFADVARTLKVAKAVGAHKGSARFSLDLAGRLSPHELLVDPAVTLVLPRLAGPGDEPAQATEVSDAGTVRRTLYECATEKITQSTVIYDEVVVPPLSEPALDLRRWHDVRAWPLARTQAVAVVGGFADTLGWM